VINLELQLVRPEDQAHRLRLQEVFRWAQEQPQAYLDGTGYTSQSFLQTPPDAVEFFILIAGRLAGLLTFFRLRVGVARVGLITAPSVSVWRLSSVLRAIQQALPGYGIHELWARLPEQPCFDRARALVRRLGFRPANKTDWRLELNGHTKQ
jgi:hypothetical protein